MEDQRPRPGEGDILAEAGLEAERPAPDGGLTRAGHWAGEGEGATVGDEPTGVVDGASHGGPAASSVLDDTGIGDRVGAGDDGQGRAVVAVDERPGGVDEGHPSIA